MCRFTNNVLTDVSKILHVRRVDGVFLWHLLSFENYGRRYMIINKVNMDVFYIFMAIID